MTRFQTTTISALIFATITGCMTPPPELDLSLQHPSQDKKFIVTLQPPAAPPAINQIHSWQVQPQTTTAEFDDTRPEGADYVVVPAVPDADDPTLLAWLRAFPG